MSNACVTLLMGVSWQDCILAVIIHVHTISSSLNVLKESMKVCELYSIMSVGRADSLD